MPINLRPTTNLRIPNNLMLNSDDNRRGFMFFYNNAYGEFSTSYYARIWISAILGSTDLVDSRDFCRTKAQMREFNKLVGRTAGELSIQKMVDDPEPFYQIHVPVATVSGSMGFKGILTAAFQERNRPLSEERLEQINAAVDKFNEWVATHSKVEITLDQAMDYVDAHGAEETAYNDTFISAELINRNGAVSLFVTMAIEAYEAEQLTTTPWAQIRNVDLYPILLNWVAHGLGARGKPPLASFPISKVAATLPQSNLIKPRINQDGLSVGADGRPRYLPAKLDDTSGYEDAYNKAGAREDGAFRLLDRDDDGDHRSLPADRPVLIDWVNNRYAYTSPSGSLEVEDLSRFRVPNATNIVRWLMEPVNPKILTSLRNIAQVVSAKPFEVRDSDLVDIGAIGERLKTFSDPVDYFKVVSSLNENFTGNPQVMWRDLNGSEFKALLPLQRWIANVGSAIIRNLDSAYSKLSIRYVSTILPYSILVGVYAPKIEEFHQEDRNLRSVYFNQGADPNWKGSSLPFVSKKLLQLPHQYRARNELRDHPKFAILAIPAGGGKTPVIVMDILSFYKKNVGFPYVIFCPSHLVPQYVNEIAYFTDGKLNAIPINTTTLGTQSLDRVTKMIQNSPRNTVVIVDFDVTSNILADDVMYGTTPITVYHVIEFLRQFNFGYAALDESHYLKNDSRRAEAINSLVVEIPYKRLASGTLAHDSMTDLAQQIAIFDPSIFGTREAFNERFGAEIRQGRVVEWRPNAALEISHIIKSNVVMCRAHRKEWAALLPDLEENIHLVNLKPAQKLAYDELLQQVINDMEQEAKKNPLLRRFLTGNTLEGEDEADNEIQASDLEALLKPYIARLERFLTAMGRDDWGKVKLSGDDLFSPKIEKIIELIKKHIALKIPGKVIVFTNYTWSAEEIYEQLPAEIKKRFLLYTAAQKVEIMAKFEQPDIIGMVGVSASMDTGVNLQSASRLIREAGVWNPGTKEQGDSRIIRPQLKRTDARTKVFVDWVLANGTIDVTKVCRLYSKMLSVAKFDNAGDPRYAKLPDPEVISMTLDTILTVNNFQDPEVLAYTKAYGELVNVVQDDLAEYRRTHKDLLSKAGNIEQAPDPKDARFLDCVPFAPGTELFGQDEMGLVRVDLYLDSDEVVNPDSDETWEQQATAALKGMRAYTEFGEGTITRVSSNSVTVRLPEGQITLRQSQVFVNTARQLVSVNKARAKFIGLPQETVKDLPNSNLLRKSASTKKVINKEIEDLKTGPDVDGNLSVEITVSVLNGFLSLSYVPTSKTDPVAAALQAGGFSYSPAYKYAEVKTHTRLLNQMKVWAEKGFQIDTSMGDTSGQFKDMYELMKAKRLKDHTAFIRYAQASGVKNFMRLEFKPSSNPKMIRPFPLIENDTAYIALPSKGQRGTTNAIKYKAPGVIWTDAEPTLRVFTLTVAKAAQILTRLNKAGVQIANSPDVKKQLTALKKAKLRQDEE